MSSAWLVSGKRTPIGRFLGDLAPLSAPCLAGHAIKETIRCSDIDISDISEIILGQVLTAGAGQAPTRQALHAAGLPDDIGAVTVNKVCGSGMFSVMLAVRSIQAGAYRAAVAGGMESMSQAPHLLRGGRSGWKYGSEPLLDTIENDGLKCAKNHNLMGLYAEKVARDFSLNRIELDSWALLSHQRATLAQQQQLFAAEIVSVLKSDKTLISSDSGPRSDSTIEQLARLRTAFDPAGVVTAGNSSTLSDGAAALLVIDDVVKKSLPEQPYFRVVGMSSVSRSPEDLFIAPINAIEKLLSTTHLSVSDIDLFEINEAFASQTLACVNGLRLDHSKVNVNGGAIALGHPIGCSGARILVTLMNALAIRKQQLGIAALCIGGGEAVAMLIERH